MTASSSVAIVGAGPVGLVAALLLRERGFAPIVFERRPATSAYPAAHVINTRTLEVFDELGFAEAVCAHGAPISSMPNIVWCESLAGREYGRLSMRSADPAGIERRRRVASFLPINLAQNRLEPLLLSRLTSLGAEVRYNQEVIGIAQTEGAVQLTVTDRQTGNPAQHTYDYLIGCDGAGSTVRRAAGLTMDGPRTLARFLTIYFEADLSLHAASRKALLFWIGGLQVRGFVISFDYDRTWALLCPIGEHSTEAFSETAAAGLVRKMIGDESLPFRITGITSWNMSAQVADRYSHGRVLLAGDAAHRFPPTGGLGLNTGIQDAQNLVWKLAAVLQGDADPALLATYEEERRGIAQRNCAQSVRNLQRMGEIDRALGFAMLAPIDPADGLASYRLRPDSQVGMAGGAAPALAKRAAVQAAIDGQSEHFDDSLGLELGYLYETGALVADGSPTPAQDNRDYQPTARPGSRLPHLWVRDAAGDALSTLRLVETRGLTLISAADAWLLAAAALELITAVGIGPGHAIAEPTGQWLMLFGIDAAGAVLVRPDGHVAWRSRGAPTADPRATLESVIRQVYVTGTRERQS